MSKPTFKKDSRPSGLAGCAFTAGADIKRKGNVVGRIHPPNRWRDDSYRCWFMVNTPSGVNCPWSWVEFSKGHRSLDDAKLSVQAAWSEIEALDLREVD